MRELRNALSRDSEGRGELMEAVAREGGVEARKLIAGLVGMSDECTHILSGDESWEVRRALAGNVSAPRGVLEALAGDADARVAQSAEVSLAYCRSLSEHDGDEVALYQAKAERADRDVEARIAAARERVLRDVRERFGSNYSEIPNSCLRQGAVRDWTGSHGEVAPGNKSIVFMSEGEMVEVASRVMLSSKDQESLAFFGSELVRMVLLRRDDLCEGAQVSMAVHGSERVRETLARRSVLSENVQELLAVHGGEVAKGVLAARGDLCARARRLVS